MKIRAEVLGTSKALVWFRIPWKNHTVILTQPRKHLPRGMANHPWVNIEFDGVLHSPSDVGEPPYAGFYVDDPKVTAIEQESDPSGT